MNSSHARFDMLLPDERDAVVASEASVMNAAGDDAKLAGKATRAGLPSSVVPRYPDVASEGGLIANPGREKKCRAVLQKLERTGRPDGKTNLLDVLRKSMSPSG
jgi:hypothetical protein